MLRCRWRRASALRSLTPSGWGGRIRTFEYGIQSPAPYRLATPHLAIGHPATRTMRDRLGRSQTLTRDSLRELVTLSDARTNGKRAARAFAPVRTASLTSGHEQSGPRGDA